MRRPMTEGEIHLLFTLGVIALCIVLLVWAW